MIDKLCEIHTIVEEIRNLRLDELNRIYTVTQCSLKYSNSRKRFYLFVCNIFVKAFLLWFEFSLFILFCQNITRLVSIPKYHRSLWVVFGAIILYTTVVWGNYCTYYSQLKATREEYRFPDFLCFLFSCKRN